MVNAESNNRKMYISVLYKMSENLFMKQAPELYASSKYILGSFIVITEKILKLSTHNVFIVGSMWNINLTWLITFNEFDKPFTTKPKSSTS